MDLNLSQMRAFEALALGAGNIDPATVELARQIVKLLPLLDDGSEKFAALADLVKAIAHKGVHR